MSKLGQIQLVDHSDAIMAAEIHSVLLAAYQVEASIIGAVDFPPLQRTLEQIQASSTRFYGLLGEAGLMAIAEVDLARQPSWLDAVAVHPESFRRGCATTLLTSIFHQYADLNWRVQTSVRNGPALQLYRKLGFRLRRRFRTDCGYDMIVLQRDQLIQS